MNFVTYVSDRLRDRNTWIGLTAVFSALGYHLTEAKIEDIATIGTGVCGAIAALWPSKNV